MMKRILVTFMLVFCIVCLCGCGTIMTRTNEPEGLLYPATSCDATMIKTGGGIWQVGDCDNAPTSRKLFGWLVVVPLHVIDLPFSMVLDTLMLPWDMHQRSAYREATAAEFKMWPSVPCNDAPGVLLRSMESREDYATFSLESSGQNVTVKEGALLTCPGTTDAFKVVFVGTSYVTMRKVRTKEIGARH